MKASYNNKKSETIELLGLIQMVTRLSINQIMNLVMTVIIFLMPD